MFTRLAIVLIVGCACSKFPSQFWSNFTYQQTLIKFCKLCGPFPLLILKDIMLILVFYRSPKQILWRSETPSIALSTAPPRGKSSNELFGRVVFQIDYESYEWKKLDPASEETKQLVQQYFSWSGADRAGRPFNQGKTFKWTPRVQWTPRGAPCTDSEQPRGAGVPCLVLFQFRRNSPIVRTLVCNTFLHLLFCSVPIISFICTKRVIKMFLFMHFYLFIEYRRSTCVIGELNTFWKQKFINLYIRLLLTDWIIFVQHYDIIVHFIAFIK